MLLKRLHFKKLNDYLKNFSTITVFPETRSRRIIARGLFFKNRFIEICNNMFNDVS